MIRFFDLGIGTGLLTVELAKKGGMIFGVDFSNKMIELARAKMPNGNFYCYDFKYGLPEELKEMEFNYIVSSYAMHHITNDEKVNFINGLRHNLQNKGKIIIADIAFKTKENMQRCKESCCNEWDNDEFYMIYEDIMPEIHKLGFRTKFTEISSCAGVLEVWR